MMRRALDPCMDMHEITFTPGTWILVPLVPSRQFLRFPSNGNSMSIAVRIWRITNAIWMTSQFGNAIMRRREIARFHLRCGSGEKWILTIEKNLNMPLAIV